MHGNCWNDRRLQLLSETVNLAAKPDEPAAQARGRI
jgi:hypothetical protein